jgi:catechol 2,3-dioxygenase-like lactoylglutathione lyase family enzyme
MSGATRFTGLAPQFLVDDLAVAIAFYRDVLGFRFGAPYRGFYAVGVREGAMLHLKCSPKNTSERIHRKENTHLDAFLEVEGIAALYAACQAAGAAILKPLEPADWGGQDFYLGDPDGHIIGVGGRG